MQTNSRSVDGQVNIPEHGQRRSGPGFAVEIEALAHATNFKKSHGYSSSGFEPSLHHTHQPVETEADQADGDDR